MGLRVALFGGSFDPVHHGHLIVARAIAESLSIDKVILLPAGQAPHKPNGAVASGADRVAMLRLAVEGDALFEISEHDLLRDGPCYTLDVVQYFRDASDVADELFWIIGADSLLELHEWHEPRQIARTCRIVTAARSGFDPGPLDNLRNAIDPDTFEQIKRDILETPRIDISATEIRIRINSGKSIRNLTPLKVVEYIASKSLFLQASK